MSEPKKDSVWTEEGGIVHIFQDKPFTEESVLELAEAVKEALAGAKGPTKILYRLTRKMKGSVTSSRVRKKLVDEIKDVIREYGFEKAAVYDGNTATRTVASFILGVLNVKNIKIFKTKEGAIKWLKE